MKDIQLIIKMELILEYFEHNLIALKWNDEAELMLDSHFFENDGYDPT